MLRRVTYLWCLALMAAVTGCSVIDEDLSDCVEQAKMDYELRLVTNMTTELKTQLTTETDLQIADALKQELGNIFTDYAHDVDLSFYDTEGDSTRLQHDEHFMDANQASYALNLPMRRYMHLATANILDNELVTLENGNSCHEAMLKQVDRDTIDSHSTGLFTARQPMEVLEGIDQNFNVHLYMANCSATLVIDPRGHGQLDKIRVFSTGFATGFNICDSVYHFDARSPIIRTTRTTIEGEDKLAFSSVTFPSREPQQTSTRSVIETEEPFITVPGEPLWEMQVYVPQPDGSITKNVLTTIPYTIRFLNDGVVLQSEEINFNTLPEYKGSTPTRATTAQYTFEFDKWSPAIAKVSGNQDYEATYIETLRSYTITFKNYDGTVLATPTVNYGIVPTYNGTPTKPATVQYSYTHNGWKTCMLLTT